MRALYIYIIMTAGLFYFVSCKDTNLKNHNIESEEIDLSVIKKDKNILEDSLSIAFAQSIDKMEYTSLPYMLNKELFYECCFGYSDDALILRIFNGDEEKLKKLNYCKEPETAVKFKNDDKPKLSLKLCEIFKSYDLKGLSFKLILGAIKEKEKKILSLLTFDNGEVLDVKHLNLLSGTDSYYEHALYISKNLDVKHISSSRYESAGYVSELKFKLNDEGKFYDVEKTGGYEIDVEKNFHDYKNDYEELSIPQISVKEKETLFKEFVSGIPKLTLPYNSGDFYHLMQIESPEKGKPTLTKLHHNKLQWNPNVQYFFANDPNQVSFKPNNEGYEQGYYFYPIGQFTVGAENIGVLYLYQSFCNYHPTVYVQLNTYDPQGAILDSQILDRRFYSGMYRFLSSIEIQENLSINIKRFIQNYEDFEHAAEDYKQPAPETKELSYNITPQGKITAQ